MISEKTIKFLDEFCDISDKMFQDGGTNYIFKYGRKLAHYLQNKHDIHLCFSKELSDAHMKQLQIFIDRSHGDIERVNPSEKSILISLSLLNLLQKDINYEQIYITDSFRDIYSSSLTIVMIKENDYFSLELMWILD